MYKQYYIKTDTDGRMMAFSCNPSTDHDITLMCDDEDRMEEMVEMYREGWVEVYPCN